MISTVLAHLRAQWMGALALFLVLAGGTAYAANTIGSSDIINGQVKSADIGNNQVRSIDVTNDGLTGVDILESSLATVPDADTLDGRDSKDFARLGGVINGDGSILQGSGFTVSHPSDGEYQVSFPSGTLSNANCPPLATAMVFSGIVRNPQISSRTCSGLGAGSFTIKTLDTDGVAHDTPFVFMGM